MVLTGFVRITGNGVSYITKAEWFDAETDLEEGQTYETNPDAAGKELAEFISGELEGANQHSMVDLPEKLYALIAEVAGTETADKVIAEIYTRQLFTF